MHRSTLGNEHPDHMESYLAMAHCPSRSVHMHATCGHMYPCGRYTPIAVANISLASPNRAPCLLATEVKNMQNKRRESVTKVSIDSQQVLKNVAMARQRERGCPSRMFEAGVRLVRAPVRQSSPGEQRVESR